MSDAPYNPRLVSRTRETQETRRQEAQKLAEGVSVEFSYERRSGTLSRYSGVVTRVFRTHESQKIPTVWVDGQYRLQRDEVISCSSGNRIGKLYELYVGD